MIFDLFYYINLNIKLMANTNELKAAVTKGFRESSDGSIN